MNIFKNKKGEGQIDTGIKIIIGVVIGGLLLAGLFFLVNGENGILSKTDKSITKMIHTGDTLQIRQNGTVLEQSYDGESWVNCPIPGTNETSTITSALTQVKNGKTVYLVVEKNSTGARLFVSEDGENWAVKQSDRNRITLNRAAPGGTISLFCGDGRSYTSPDGLSWTLTSTKNY